jgi:glycosyltransferase involved in cell wall biosynthesis
MKIIQICASYKPAYVYGGPTMSVSKLAEELSKAKQDVTVLSTTANGEKELDVAINKALMVDGVEVFYFKRWTKDHTHFSPGLFWKLHQLIRREKKARKSKELIVHIHAWWNLVSIFACWIAKIHRVTVVLSPRGMLNDYTLSNRNSLSKQLIHKVIGKKLLAYCHIHATADKEAREIAQMARVKSTVVIPNFVKIATNVNPTDQSKAYFNIAFLSRIEKKKGLENSFNALAKLQFPFNFSIGGTGEETYVKGLKILAEELNISKNINWLGHLTNEKKFDFLAQNDILLLSSYNENFANVIIESLAVGTPVIVSENVGLADYVKQNQLGWVCKNDADSIIDAIQQAFADTEKRNKIRNLAPTIIQKDFDEHYLVEHYVTNYKSFVDRK